MRSPPCSAELVYQAPLERKSGDHKHLTSAVAGEMVVSARHVLFFSLFTISTLVLALALALVSHAFKGHSSCLQGSLTADHRDGESKLAGT